VIGGGPGGYVASLYAAKKGLKVTLVEKRFIGGTCLNIGCIATKAFAKSSVLYHEMISSDLYGIHAENIRPDMNLIQERKQAVVNQLVGGIDYLLKAQKVEIFTGTASFIDDERVAVATKAGIITYQPQNIIIASGSKVRRLKIEGSDLDVVFDSEKMLSLREIPSSLTVIGGGIIGMEFAFIFGQMGTKVTVLEMLPSILPMVDKDVSQRLLRYAKLANITVLTQAKVLKYSLDAQGQALVHFNHNGEDKTVVSSIVLESIGRMPCTDGLDLQKTALSTAPDSSISVDEYMRTNLEHIYAIGDVTNKIQLAHVASHQALVAVDTILGHPHKMDYDCVPSVIFTHPQIACVGMTEAQMNARQIPYKVIKAPGSANGKALIENEAAGIIKLIAEAGTNRLIGAQIFGLNAENLISVLTLAIKNKLNASDLKMTIFAHPTTSELIHEAALGLLGEAIHYAG